MNTGTYTGEITFSSNDPDETSYSIPLTARLSNLTIVDNDDPAFSLVSRQRVQLRGPRHDLLRRHLHAGRSAGDGNNVVQWLFTDLAPGADYRLWGTWVGGASRATDAPFRAVAAGAADKTSIFNGREVLATDVNQQVDPSVLEGGTRWEVLGIVTLNAGENTLAVQLSDAATAGYVVADAIRLEQLERPEVELAVNGIGIQSGASVDYGQLLQLQPAIREFTVTNLGLQDLVVTSIGLASDVEFTLSTEVTLANPPAGPFPITDPFTLIHGQEATFTIELDTSTGNFGSATYDGTLLIETNDADEGNFEVDLVGTVSSFRVQDSSAESETFRLVSLNGAQNGFSQPVYDTRYYNGDYRYHAEGVGNNLVQWIFPNLAENKNYEVGVTWVGGTGRAPDAQYKVLVASGSEPADIAAATSAYDDGVDPNHPAPVDQRFDPVGPIGWHMFPLVSLDPGQNTIIIELSDDASGFVLVDAALLNVPIQLNAVEEFDSQPERLSTDAVAPVLDEAVSQYQAEGISPAEAASLADTNVLVTDLSSSVLGAASPVSNTVWLDTNAAGNGWFVDATPALNEEFAAGVAQVRYDAPAGSPAAGRVDLLTVLAHELGHLIGQGHDDHGVMGAALAVGTRLLPADMDAEPVSAGSSFDSAGLSAFAGQVGRTDWLLPLTQEQGTESEVAETTEAGLADALFASLDTARSHCSTPPTTKTNRPTRTSQERRPKTAWTSGRHSTAWIRRVDQSGPIRQSMNNRNREVGVAV